MSTQHLTATYKSPKSSEAFSSNLPSLSSDPKDQDVNSKTAYLSALRSNIVQMQSDVNAFLTKRMDEDKASEAGTVGARRVKEEKEEEMYGEEDPEAD